jgi:DNA-binding CsgD family transcriptional regulator
MSIERPRLLRLLTDSAASGDVVVLVAPPGYGKTVLLQQLAQQAAIVYVSLARTASLEGLVRELIGAVAPHSLAVTGALFGDLTGRETESVLARWILERLRPVETTIVLDDLHGIAENRPAMRLLTALVEGTRGRIRWILASRIMPVLPMSAWIVHSVTTLPITERELRFTAAEARDAAQAAGAAIDDAALEELLARNAGWPIGMQLALEAWNRVGDVRSSVAETRQQLLMYLQTELWNGLSPQARALVVACALVRGISEGVLRDAGFAGADDRLPARERHVPLVTRLPDGRFALVDLFRDFVLEEIITDTKLVNHTADALGPALARAGRDADALELARSTKQPARILAVLDDCGLHLIDSGARGLLEETLASLPPELAAHGIVRAMRGGIAQSNGRRDEAERAFSASLRTGDLSVPLRSDVVIRLAGLHTSRLDAGGAIELLRPLVRDPSVPGDRRGMLLGLFAVSLAIAGHAAEAGAVAAESQNITGREGAGVLEPVHRFLALTYFYLDAFERARRHAIDALASAREIGDDRTVMSAYSVLLAIAESDDLDAEPSRVYAAEIVAAGMRLGDRGVQRHGLCCQLMIAARAGDGAQIDRLQASLAALGTGPVYAEFGCETDLAVYYASEGDIERARARLRAKPDRRLSPAEEYYRESIAELIGILAGEDATAAPALPALGDGANVIERRYLDDAGYCSALALWARDRPVQARRALPRGDALGRRGRLILEVVAEIVRLPHPVPDEAAVEAVCARLQPFGLGAIGKLFFRIATHEKSRVMLSPAEIALLATFARTGGRTADVARVLNKSPHTVRNQMRSVFGKIGCSGRDEAIAYARQRGWLET